MNRAIELEVFRHLLASIAEEMGIVLRKTAFSANIKERRDYSCAVYDSHAQTVAMGEHMPVHLGAMPMSVRYAIDEVAPGPGDVVILNDPFRGGTHLPDITAVSGVFLNGQRKPSFYLANRAHHADVGGMAPGSMPMAQEIYQEGLRIPPMLLVHRGRVREDILGLILANVRTPAEREGDLLAQLMSLRRGETRLHSLVERYGKPALSRNMKRLLDYSELMMRAALTRVPDGEYRFEDCIDSDGFTPGPVWIRVTVRIAGDRALVDFTGTDAQRAGPVNANLAIVTAATAYVFRCLLDDDVPFTSGLLRPIEIVAPKGSVVNAEAPAAMAAGNVETSQRITDVLLGALAQALPGRIPAASSGTMNNFSFGGFDSHRSRRFAHYETIAGGMGASPRAPGHSAVHTHMTNSWNTPVEALEYQFPMRVTAYSVRRGSGGKGRNRGGDGIIREYEFLEAARATLLADRRDRGPWGLQGGEPGQPGRNVRIRPGHRPETVAAKTEFAVAPGERVRIETPGGGGWGEARTG
ncbi:MAG: hydantoinase B/oxoprolinase family protein [Bryobacteraceae bacterium]|nr:hydantoinase B/oxoprolinase family protein [Bryobacteraceae bacterium]